MAQAVVFRLSRERVTARRQLRTASDSFGQLRTASDILTIRNTPNNFGIFCPTIGTFFFVTFRNFFFKLKSLLNRSPEGESHLNGPLEDVTASDSFGQLWTASDSFGQLRTASDSFGQLRTF